MHRNTQSNFQDPGTRTLQKTPVPAKNCSRHLSPCLVLLVSRHFPLSRCLVLQKQASDSSHRLSIPHQSLFRWLRAHLPSIPGIFEDATLDSMVLPSCFHSHAPNSEMWHWRHTWPSQDGHLWSAGHKIPPPLHLQGCVHWQQPREHQGCSVNMPLDAKSKGYSTSSDHCYFYKIVSYLGNLTPTANTVIPLSFTCLAGSAMVPCDFPSERMIRISGMEEFLPPGKPFRRMYFSARPVSVFPPLKESEKIGRGEVRLSSALVQLLFTSLPCPYAQDLRVYLSR